MRIYLETVGARQVWRADFVVGGKRTRKNFESQEQAENWARTYRHVIARDGERGAARWLAVSDEVRDDILAAIEFLQQNGVPFEGGVFTEAARLIVDHRARQPDRQISIEVAVAEHMVHRRRHKQGGPAYLENVEICLGKFARAFRGMRINELTEHLIRDWLHDQDWDEKTFNKYRCYIRTLIEWAKLDGRCWEGPNPIDKIPYIKPDDDEEIVVPPPADVARILAASLRHPEWAMTSPLAAQFGFGMRTCEVCRVDVSDIRASQDIIRVRNKVAKTGTRRNIPMDGPLFPTFRELLLGHLPARGPLAPENFYCLREKVCRAAGVRWIWNMGRRSFASYHYAKTGDDTATRFILGHIGRVEVFIRHYRSVDIIENGDLRPLAPADAREYWIEMADLIAQFASQDDAVALLECAHAA